MPCSQDPKVFFHGATKPGTNASKQASRASTKMKNIGWIILLALVAAPLLGLGTYSLHLMIIALLWSYIVLSETLRIAIGSQLHGIDPLFHRALLILFIISMPKGILGELPHRLPKKHV